MEPCRKIRYVDKKAAKTQLNIAKGRRKKLPTAVYYCGQCTAWHLTSKERMIPVKFKK